MPVYTHTMKFQGESGKPSQVGHQLAQNQLLHTTWQTGPDIVCQRRSASDRSSALSWTTTSCERRTLHTSFGDQLTSPPPMSSGEIPTCVGQGPAICAGVALPLCTTLPSFSVGFLEDRLRGSALHSQ